MTDLTNLNAEIVADGTVEEAAKEIWRWSRTNPTSIPTLWFIIGVLLGRLMRPK
jgi:hypothetical protein